MDCLPMCRRTIEGQTAGSTVTEATTWHRDRRSGARAAYALVVEAVETVVETVGFPVETVETVGEGFIQINPSQRSLWSLQESQRSLQRSLRRSLTVSTLNARALLSATPVSVSACRDCRSCWFSRGDRRDE